MEIKFVPQVGTVGQKSNSVSFVYYVKSVNNLNPWHDVRDRCSLREHNTLLA